MHKDAFCDDMDARLRGVEEYLAGVTFPAPSTLAKSQQQERERPIVEELRALVAVARAQLDGLRSSADPVKEPAHDELSGRWAAIDELLQELR